MMSTVRHIALAALLPALVAAAPLADPLQMRLVADAAALGPATLGFERSVRVTASDGTSSKVETRVDRWDGRGWTLLSIDGKPADTAAAAKDAKARAGKPVPGYYRLAAFFGIPATRTTDASGATILRLAALPPGSIDIAGDRSDQFAAEATVDTSGPKPWVRRLHAYARAPFRIMIVGRIDRFDLVNDYALDAGGHPVLVRQVQDYAGSGPGQSGSVRTETVYRGLR